MTRYLIGVGTELQNTWLVERSCLKSAQLLFMVQPTSTLKTEQGINKSAKLYGLLVYNLNKTFLNF